MFKRIIFIGFGIICLGCFYCNPDVSGPKFWENRKLALFCILNPSQQNQVIVLNRTISFDEAQKNYIGDISVRNADIIFKGQEGNTEAIPMPKNADIYQHDIRIPSDFLSGTGKFTHVISDQVIEYEKEYSISIYSEEYGNISAQTVVPGSFEITDIKKNEGINNNYEISWTPSAGAAGYLVEMTLLDYDISKILEIQKLYESESGDLLITRSYIGDSTEILQFPYQEQRQDIDKIADVKVGILTQKTKINIDYRISIFGAVYEQAPDLPSDVYGNTISQYRQGSLYQDRFYIHALDPALYSYMAFEIRMFKNEGTRVGQIAILPDRTNIQGGVGVFGAACTRSLTSEQKTKFLPNIGEPMPGDPDFSQAPTLLSPYDGSKFGPGDTLSFHWEPVADAVEYLLVLKPHYLWFWPGNVSFLLQQTDHKIAWENLQIRDAKIEWYVKAINNDLHHELVDSLLFLQLGLRAPDILDYIRRSQTAISDAPPDKGPLVFNGQFFGFIFKYQYQYFRFGDSSGLSHPVFKLFYETPWSESRFAYTQSGEIPGFEEIKPVSNSSLNNTSLSAGKTFDWQNISGADAYLLHIKAENGENYVTAHLDNRCILPPRNEVFWSEGLTEQVELTEGTYYSCYVCALRVKSGMLGFVVEENSSEILPKVYPRYVHPSGIIQQSKWSEELNFLYVN